MNTISPIYVYTFYFLFILILITGIVKLYLLKKIQYFIKNKTSLQQKFPLPNLILVTLSFVLILLSISLAYLALFQTKPNEAEISSSQNSVDILFLIDVSLSMNATDVYPSRLKRVQDVLLRIAPDLVGNRVGVVVFAGGAFSFCPMTSDMTAFSDYINSLGVDIVGRKGTDMAAAFDKANKILSSSKVLKNRIVVLVSDGENHESNQFSKLDSELQVWGVGTEQGGSIYFGDENSKSAGYVTIYGGLTNSEKSTDLLISKLNENTLRTIAETNNGTYYDLSYESLGAYRLLDKILEMKKNQTILLQKIRKEDGAEIFLILAVLCLFIERLLRLFFYVRPPMTILLIIFLISGRSVYAWDLDPGGNRIKEGVKLYEEKNYKDSELKLQEAEEYFENDSRLKFNQANNDYKLGKYAEAIQKNNEVISDANQGNDIKSKAHYNNGNAYFKLNDLKSAQKSYEEALALNPNHEAAKINLELLRKKNPNEQNQNPEKKEKSKPNSNPKNESEKQSQKNQSQKDNADRMMDNFSPDSILKKKSPNGGRNDNEKFW